MQQYALNLSNLFNISFYPLGDAVLSGSLPSAERHLESFPNDSTGLEAFVNHVHLEDVTNLDAEKDREILLAIGRNIINVWKDRLQPYVNGRKIVFFLGGSDSVSLRFHIIRNDGRDWIDLSDQKLIDRERIEVFQF
jgi:hypothetical protein